MATRQPYADLRTPTPLVTDIPPRTSPRWLRAFGYATAALVWLAVFAIAVAATVFALPAALDGAVGPLGDAPGFRGGSGMAVAIAFVVLLGPILGWLTAFVVPASLGVLLDAATLLTRSLRRRYAAEQLSFSKWSKGELAGPVFGTGAYTVAVSLMPWRLTRWSKLVAIVRFNGWVPNSNWFVIGTVWGWGYGWTCGWILWPAAGAWRAVGIAATVVFAAAVGALIAARRQLIADVMIEPFRKTVYARSWPNVPAHRRSKKQRTTKIAAKYAAVLADQPERYEDET